MEKGSVKEDKSNVASPCPNKWEKISVRINFVLTYLAPNRFSLSSKSLQDTGLCCQDFVHCGFAHVRQCNLPLTGLFMGEIFEKFVKS